MNRPDSKPEPHVTVDSERRDFMRYSSAALVGALAFGVTVTSLQLPAAFAAVSVDLGSGDIGVLNYAYALEQLEAAFYTQVLKTRYSGMSTEEREILTSIRQHEIAHRELFKAALGKKAIAGLTPEFGKVDFDSRKSVLTTARTFEDLGVAAYNGAGKLIKNGDYLVLAGKIVSVEARHAAAIRDLLNPHSQAFAGDDVVNSSGLDGAKSPSTVLGAAAPFVQNDISANGLSR